MSGESVGQVLRGKVAFITGGARGIGLAVAKRYAAAGADVVIADISGDQLREAEAELNRTWHGKAFSIRVDVTNEEEIAAAADYTANTLGGVDIVVANAGILLLRHAVDISADEWRRIIDVNLTGAFLTCKVFAKTMIERKRGDRILLTSSLFGVRGGRENAAYSASKFGIVGLTQSLAAELATYNISVNAICPGQMDTEMMRQLFRERADLTKLSEQSVADALLSRIPMRRLGGMDELADVYLFLASSLSRYMTGQSIVVDGGWLVA